MLVWPGSRTRSARPSTERGRTSRSSPRSPSGSSCACSTRTDETRVELTEVDGVRLARLPARRRSPGSATATACTARTTPSRASAATRPSCCSTPTPRRSTGQIDWDESLFSYRFDDPNGRNDADSRAARCCSRSSSTRSSTGATTGRRGTPYHETVIYEAHVKGLTMTHPEVPEEIRGTYAGARAPGDASSTSSGSASPRSS